MTVTDGTIHCLARGCHVWTQAGKAYCAEHILGNPYAREVRDRLDRMDAEVDAIARHGRRRVNVDGPIAQEVLWVLEFQGPQTEQGLLRALRPYLGTRRDVAVALGDALVRTEKAVWLGGIRERRLATPGWEPETEVAPKADAICAAPDCAKPFARKKPKHIYCTLACGERARYQPRTA